ncbi:MAG: RNA methyltransferase [Alphaproteobacteria bacterium]|nr:RNA methyltransferase [Alphaproteobacteria bacterium]
MAGTDSTAKKTGAAAINAPAVILVKPQLGENIGMCARAMLNCAVTDLRLVAPRDGWPNPAAAAAASGATELLDNAKVFDTTQEAVADLTYVLATTARGRGMVKDILDPHAAAREIHKHNSANAEQKCGILFGCERAGLDNDDIALANAILSIPLNPGFTSLNLAQAVLLVCFSWLSAENPFKPAAAPEAPAAAEQQNDAPASQAEIETLLKHLESQLELNNFFRSAEQKPTLLRNIRNFFFRSSPTRQDVRTLHGIFKCLTGNRDWK